MNFRLSMAQRFKIGAGFAILSLLFLGLTSVYQILLLNQDVEAFFQLELQTIAAFDHLSEIHEDLRVLNLSPMTSLRPDLSVGIVNRLADISSRTSVIGKLASTTRLPLENLAVQAASFVKVLAILSPLPQRRLADPASSTHDSPGLLASDTINLRDSRDHLLAAVAVVQAFSRDRFSAHQWQIQSINQATQARIGLLTLFTIIVVVLLGIFFAQQITLPIQRVIDLINRIRDGQYLVTVREQSDDEIGRIFNSLVHMTQHIHTRDLLKRDKIDQEKRRFEVLGGFLDQLGVPILLINQHKQVAYASHQFLDMFRLKIGEIFEIELPQLAIPLELKDEILKAIQGQHWITEKKLELIGENYAHDLVISILPVRNAKGIADSVICLLKKPGK